MVANVAVPVHLIVSLNFLIGSRNSTKAFSTQEILDMLHRIIEAEEMRSAHLEGALHSSGVRSQKPSSA